MTEPVQQHKRTEARCEHCGTIRIEFDPPLQFELDEDSEILQDKVFVLKHALGAPGASFWITLALFWTLAGAQFAMRAQIAAGTDPERLEIEPVTVHL